MLSNVAVYRYTAEADHTEAVSLREVVAEKETALAAALAAAAVEHAAAESKAAELDAAKAEQSVALHAAAEAAAACAAAAAGGAAERESLLTRAVASLEYQLQVERATVTVGHKLLIPVGSITLESSRFQPMNPQM